MTLPTSLNAYWLFAAITFGAVTATASFLLCWLIDGPRKVAHTQNLTYMALASLQNSAMEYYVKNGRFPHSISEILEQCHDLDAGINRPQNRPDYWGHPIRYFFDDKKAEFLSYGRDGVPGGIGVDRDCSSSDERVSPAVPPLGQFIEVFGRDFMIGSAVIGVIAMLRFLSVVEPMDFQQPIKLPTNRLIVTTVINLLLVFVLCALLRGPKP